MPVSPSACLFAGALGIWAYVLQRPPQVHVSCPDCVCCGEAGRSPPAQAEAPAVINLWAVALVLLVGLTGVYLYAGQASAPVNVEGDNGGSRNTRRPGAAGSRA